MSENPYASPRKESLPHAEGRQGNRLFVAALALTACSVAVLILGFVATTIAIGASMSELSPDNPPPTPDQMPLGILVGFSAFGIAVAVSIAMGVVAFGLFVVSLKRTARRRS